MNNKSGNIKNNNYTSVTKTLYKEESKWWRNNSTSGEATKDQWSSKVEARKIVVNKRCMNKETN